MAEPTIFKFKCTYCKWTGISEVHLKRHISMYHEKELVAEGRRAREKEGEEKSEGFHPKIHNIIQGYLHKCDSGSKGQVYKTETETYEGVIFRWRCVKCDKILKEWFEKWTPESKERYLLLKTKGYTGYNVMELFERARATIVRKLLP